MIINILNYYIYSFVDNTLYDISKSFHFLKSRQTFSLIVFNHLADSAVGIYFSRC